MNPQPSTGTPQISQQGLVDYGLAACIDVETTGLNAGSDEVIEFGLVLFRYIWSQGRITEVVDVYSGLRAPSGGAIPDDAVAVHGITNEMVAGQQLDGQRIVQLLQQAEFIVAHNAEFDYEFVRRLYHEAAGKPWLCSMRQVDWRRHGHRSRRLQDLLRAHGIKVSVAHRAEDDCRSVLNLLNQPGLFGQTYFHELLTHLSKPLAGGSAPNRTTETAGQIGFDFTTEA